MKDCLLLIMEEDLASRFLFFQQETKIQSHVLKIKTSLKHGSFMTLISRLKFKRLIDSEYEITKQKIYGCKRIFISNPEGFIAKNIIFKLRKDFPELEIISLQHGIFALKNKSLIKSVLIKIINYFSKILLGYFILGDGFGERTTDRYIVYNNWYKQFLIGQGWPENKITISSYFLKGSKPESKVVNQPGLVAVFFLQCLSKLGITDNQTEQLIIATVIKKLSQRYQKVFIKQHPYAEVDLPQLPENVCVIKDVPPPSDISFVISAFSTALLDYEKYGIPYTAIYSKRLKVDKIVYDQFLMIHNFDESKDDFEITRNNTRKDLPVFFDVGETNMEKI